MDFGVLAQIVLAGVHLFSDERQRHFVKVVEDLQKEIDHQEDAEFSKKDQNSKGQAQRALARRKVALASEFATELKGTKQT